MNNCDPLCKLDCPYLTNMYSMQKNGDPLPNGLAGKIGHRQTPDTNSSHKLC